MTQYIEGCPRCAAQWLHDTGGTQLPPENESARLAWIAEAEALADLEHNHPAEQPSAPVKRETIGWRPVTVHPLAARADARHLPLPDESVDLIVTSPPYFGLRSYTDTVKCYECIQMEYNGRDPQQAWPDYAAHVREVHQRHYAGQIGSEASPQEFLEALWACTAEWVRCLKPSGSIFVNLGDKYNSAASNQQSGTVLLATRGAPRAAGQGQATGGRSRAVDSYPAKSLLGLPWRYAIGCVDRLGLILRAEIIWSKPNGLPESVTDRVRRSHEQVFHFVKSPRYFSAVDEIREPQMHGLDRTGRARPMSTKWQERADGGDTRFRAVERTLNPLGKLPSSVWEIEEDHGTLRRVLLAIHTGNLTVDEGERILTGAAWTGYSGSGPMWTSRETAGSGPAAAPPRATASSGSTARPSSPTASPTPSPTARSQTASTSSTTPAASGDASGTPSPSPSARTSCEGQLPSPPSTQPRPTASTGTSSPTPTPTGQPMGSECAGSVFGQATAAPTGGRRASQSEPGSVWNIPSAPLTVPARLGVDHFAAFPPALVRPLVLGWSPSGVCTVCNQGRRPVVVGGRNGDGSKPHKAAQRVASFDWAAWKESEPHRITGYVCGCAEPSAPTRPAVVVDPFGGTGTTALVASVFGRAGISFDLSMDYSRLARWRVADAGERARALDVPRPPRQVDGQAELFGELT